MIEKIGPIKNPLTIIAIFAAIAEISGTVVLPFIAEENQTVYVWFLMVFPILLISLFFLTLNFNHKVLYAPSDYKNEDNFLHSLQRATYTEKALKLEAEVLEEQAATEQAQTETVSPSEDRSMELTPSKLPSTPVPTQEFHKTDIRARHMLAEDLIFRKLATEFVHPIQREVRVGAAGDSYIFDGIVFESSTITIVEVKYISRGFVPSSYLYQILFRIQKTVRTFQLSDVPKVRVLLVLVSEEAGPQSNFDKMNARIDRFRSEFSFAIEMRSYNLNELKHEMGIDA